MVNPCPNATPIVDTIAAIEALSRLAHYGRDTLSLSDAALTNELHRYNDTNALGLPASFIDELSFAVTRAAI